MVRWSEFLISCFGRVSDALFFCPTHIKQSFSRGENREHIKEWDEIGKERTEKNERAENYKVVGFGFFKELQSVDSTYIKWLTFSHSFSESFFRLQLFTVYKQYLQHELWNCVKLSSSFCTTNADLQFFIQSHQTLYRETIC